MESTYFLSDIHLGANNVNEERERILCKFLNEVPKSGDKIFFNGDLFDFFFDYKHVIPKGHYRTLGALQSLYKRNISLEYIAGNHDFWAGGFFEKEMHAIFHSNPVIRKINGKTFYLNHGDGIKKKDVGYRILKKIFRNPVNIFLYRWLHPDIGVPFAKFCSHSSRKYTTEKNYGDDVEYIEFAKRKFRQDIDYVILSHSHRPIFHKEGQNIYINSGDWIKYFTFALFDDKGLRLLQYKDGEITAFSPDFKP